MWPTRAKALLQSETLPISMPISIFIDTHGLEGKRPAAGHCHWASNLVSACRHWIHYQKHRDKERYGPVVARVSYGGQLQMRGVCGDRGVHRRRLHDYIGRLMHATGGLSIKPCSHLDKKLTRTISGLRRSILTSTYLAVLLSPQVRDDT